MKKNKKVNSTAVLFCIVLLVVVYAYFYEYKGKIAKQEQEDKGKIILTTPLEQITEFTVVNPDGKFVFHKIDKTWQMTEPVKDLASYGAVQGFLSQFGAEKYVEVVAEGANLNESIYGFKADKDAKDKPSELILKYPDKTVTVEVGTAAALNGRRYIRLNNEPKVYLASYTWEFLLRKDMYDMREKTLIASDFEPTTINIKNSFGTLNFELGENKKWVLKNITTKDPEQTAIDDIRYQLMATRALKIDSDTQDPKILKETGLLNPSVEIWLTNKDKKELKISLAKNGENQVFATSTARTPIFEMPPNTLEIFNKEANDFRDKKRPLKFEMSQVNQIEFIGDFSNFQIQKQAKKEITSKDEWTLANGKPTEQVDTTKATDLLNKLSNLKVKRFFESDVDYQRSGTQSLILRDNQGNELLKLQWSPKPFKDVFVAKSQLSDKLFGLSTKDMDALPIRDIIKDKKEEKK
jgi:hypothetical protein